MRIVQRRRQRGFIPLSVQIQPDQLLSPQAEQQDTRQKDQRADIYFKAKGMPHALGVPLAAKLRAENAGAGDGAEYSQIKHKQQLVHNGDPDICSVPTRPTIILSNNPTKFVIPFWIMMGMAIANIFL